jgi:hypothetical protein
MRHPWPAPGTGPRDDGAAALEFALVSPLLFSLLLVTVSAGWGLWEYQAAGGTAREAARLASVGVPDQAAFGRGVVCLGKGNGMRDGALATIDLRFHADALLTGLAGTAAAPGGYVEVRLIYVPALRGVVPSLLADGDGRVTTSAVARIEQRGPADLGTDVSLVTSGQECV